MEALGEGEQQEKHMKFERRGMRFDPERRFGCLQGRTATRSQNVFGCEDPSGLEMVVERPETEDGVVLSRLDLEGIARPELLTSVPVKSGVAEELCDVLERLCVASSIKRHPDHPGFALRVFELAPAGTRAHEQPPAASEKVPLLGAPRRQEPDALPAALALLAPGPPEDVMEQTLMRRAKLSWRGCAELPKSFRERVRGPAPLRPWEARVGYPVGGSHRNLSELACWVQEGPDSYLEVDLGADCSVTNVSTMGRFPPVKQYPEPHVWERWLQERPELGRGGWERREFAKRHRASVVNPDGRGWQQWVTRYELHARTEGGKAWTVIGTFEGNSDMTSEVAHDLREACRSPDGLRCRFLRFLPQGHHGGPAMRVGVYGVPLGKGAVAASAREAESAERVRYLVPVPLSGRNGRRRQRDFFSRRSWSPDWYGKYGRDFPIRRRRALRAREARLEAREALGGPGAEPAAPPEGPARVEPAEPAAQPRREALGAAGEEGDAAPPPEGPAPAEPAAQPQPRLQRAVSQRVAEALDGPAPPVRTATDEERGYCSDPEDLELDVSDWHEVGRLPEQPPGPVRTRTDEERGYCSEPEEPLLATGGWALV